MWGGESNQQPCEGVIDRVNKQRQGGAMTGIEHKIKKMCFKQFHLQLACKHGCTNKAPLWRNLLNPF